MKKVLLILMAAFVTASLTHLSAQTTLTQTDPAGNAATVNTNADTSHHSITLSGSLNNFSNLTFAVKGTKTSGTVAGAVTLWGSVDNSRWYELYAKTNVSNEDTTHSQALTDGNNDIVFHVTNTKWIYYRVKVITSGTQVSSYVAKLVARKVPN